MGTLFKIIIFAVIIHYIFKLVFRFVFPWFISNRAKKMQQEKEKAHRDYMNRKRNSEGKVTIEYDTSNKKRNNRQEGEYVDFEEIE